MFDLANIYSHCASKALSCMIRVDISTGIKKHIPWAGGATPAFSFTFSMLDSDKPTSNLQLSFLLIIYNSWI